MTARALLPVHAAGLAVAALLVGGCGLSGEPERDESGAIVETAAAADIFSIAVGDCTNDPEDDDAEEVVSVEAVPCDGPHDNEAYHAEDLPDGEFPGEEAVLEAAEEICLSQFEAFVGLPYEESRLSVFPYRPTQEGWEQAEDREVLCMVYDTAGEPLVGSVAGIAE